MDRKTNAISYLPLEAMDEEMAGRDGPVQCARATPTARRVRRWRRPHVFPPCLSGLSLGRGRRSSADGVCDHAVKELCRVYVVALGEMRVTCGNQRLGAGPGPRALSEGQYDDLPQLRETSAPGSPSAREGGAGPTAEAITWRLGLRRCACGKRLSPAFLRARKLVGARLLSIAPDHGPAELAAASWTSSTTRVLAGTGRLHGAGLSAQPQALAASKGRRRITGAQKPTHLKPAGPKHPHRP